MMGSKIYLSVSFQVWPDFESWDPLANNSLLSSKGNSKNVGVLSSEHLLKTLATSSSYCIGEKTGDLHFNNIHKHQLE